MLFTVFHLVFGFRMKPIYHQWTCPNSRNQKLMDERVNIPYKSNMVSVNRFPDRRFLQCMYISLVFFDTNMYYYIYAEPPHNGLQFEINH